MGRQINVYDGPLSPEDYFHLKVRENQFAISENERIYGDVGKGWTEEQWADVRAMLNPNEKKEASDSWDAAAKVDPEEDEISFDNDDVEFVRNLSYEEVQRQIKDREGLDELPQGRDEDLRNRLFGLILEAKEDEVDEDEELDESDQK